MRIIIIIILLIMTLTSYSQWNTVGQSTVEPTGKDIPNPWFNNFDSTTYFFNKKVGGYVEYGNQIWVDDFIENGDTSDHQAIQRCIDYGVANNLRDVAFSERIYILKDTVLIENEGFVFTGRGMGHSTFTGGVPTFNGGTILTTDVVGLSTLIHTTRDFQAKDIYFSGGSVSPKFANSGIVFSSDRNAPERPIYFDRCRFQEFQQAVKVVDTDASNDFNVVIGGTVRFSQCFGQLNEYGLFIESGCHIQGLHIVGCNFRNNFWLRGEVLAHTEIENNIFEGNVNFAELIIDGAFKMSNNYFEANSGDFIMKIDGKSSATAYRTYLNAEEQNNITIDPATGLETFPNFLTVSNCVLNFPRKRGNTAGVVIIEKEITNNTFGLGTDLGYGGGYQFKTDVTGATINNASLCLPAMNYIGVEPNVTDTIQVEGSEFLAGTPTEYTTPYGIKQGINLTDYQVLNNSPLTYAQGDLITISMLVRYNNASSAAKSAQIDLTDGGVLRASTSNVSIFSERQWFLLVTTLRARSAGTSVDVRFGADLTGTGEDIDIACMTIQKKTPTSTVANSTEKIFPYIK